MIPLFYLDVDGCINVVRSTRPWNVPEECWQFEIIRGFPIRWDVRVVNAVNRWHFTGMAEIRWLTTWESLAATSFAPRLGLAHFTAPEVCSRDLPPRESTVDSHWPWWKFDSVRHHADADWLEDRAVVWVDDDLAHGLRTDPLLARWVRDREVRGLRTLLVSPDSRYGLTQDLLRTIGLFLDGRGKDFAVITSE